GARSTRSDSTAPGAERLGSAGSTTDTRPPPLRAGQEAPQPPRIGADPPRHCVAHRAIRWRKFAALRGARAWGRFVANMLFLFRPPDHPGGFFILDPARPFPIGNQGSRR